MIIQRINNSSSERKLFALLLDPENYSEREAANVSQEADRAGVDFILVGGSLISKPLDGFIQTIKLNCSIPVIIFPGSAMQVSPEADGIFYLSLISGRNPEFLIGNHVISSKILQKTDIEIIPTGYILVSGGKGVSSVEYISNTKPIPEDKPDIIVSTALAGQYLGLKAIYLEGGSGARAAIPGEVITEVKKNIKVPLIVGGGLKTKEDVNVACRAGADMVVVGNAIEQGSYKLHEMVDSVSLR
jgi:putative glycerol-1-phosphate prenyltransferase